MLEKFVEKLERVAPNHPETLRAKAALAVSPRVELRAWIGLLVVFIPAFVTAAHAILRARWVRARRRCTAVAAAVGVTLCISAFSGNALADGTAPESENLTSWTINDKDPENSIPSLATNKNPLEFGYWIQDVVAKGLDASKNGDHEAAARYFPAIVKAVPDRTGA